MLNNKRRFWIAPLIILVRDMKNRPIFEVLFIEMAGKFLASVLFYLGSLNAQTEIQTLNLTSSESFDDYCLVYLVAGPPSQTHVPVLPYFISESVSK